MKKVKLVLVVFLSCIFAHLSAQEKQDHAEVLITVKDGGTVQLGNVKIEIPAGALSQDTVISISRLNEVADTGESISNATLSAGGYRFLPAGTKFSKNVVISIPYEPSLNAKPLVLNDTYTYFYDVNQKGWIQLERKAIDTENCLIQSYTTHFTDMINATLTMPETASPVDFNLNSIKSLEASKADSQVLNFNPPQGSNYGDAGFSLSLDIPSGRNGMQPQVSLYYSSNIGNGIVGKGFDINYGSSITIDTRKKVPDYNEEDIYLLDGIQLRLKQKTNDYWEYEPKRKTSYQIIRRYNPWAKKDSGKKDFWEVISSNGIVSRYGYTDNSTVGEGEKIFTWNLTKVQDKSSNYIEYKYIKDSGYVYISEILYTGHKDKAPSYKIVFTYDADRKDIRVDARSGEAVSCKQRIQEIDTIYVQDGTVIRSYNFIYTEGLSKTSLLNQFIVYSSYDSQGKRQSYEYSFDYYGVENDKYFGKPIKFSDKDEIDKSSSFSGGGSIYGSGGMGVGTENFDVRATGGGSTGHSSSDSDTEITVLDINGDGYADRIEKTGKDIKVYLGNAIGFSKNSNNIKVQWLAEKKDFEINDQHSSTDSDSWMAYGGVLAGGKDSLKGGAGYTFTKTKTNSVNESYSCFMDVDADGYVDIVIDTETYLRNIDGTLNFTECKIKNFPSFEIKRLTDKEKRAYSKSYLMNRPFRIWKAPYNGTVEVKNKVQSDNQNLKGNVYYKNGSLEEKHIINVNNSLELDVELKQDQNIYFVPDTGDDIPKDINENRNKSLDWDITINYTSVKPFYYEGNYVYLFPPSIIGVEVRTNTDFQGHPISVSSWEFKSNDIPKGLKLLYSAPGVYDTSVSLNLNWFNSIKSLDEESIRYLINNQKFIPYVITETQMKSLKNKNDFNLLKNFYQYDYASRCFYFDEEAFKNFYIVNVTTVSNNKILTLFKDIKDESLKNYNLADIPVMYKVNENEITPVYEVSKTITLEENDRFNNVRGTYSENGKRFNVNTKIGEDYVEYIYLNEEGKWELASTHNEYELLEVISEQSSLVIKLQDKEQKYIISLLFESKKPNISIITKEEMEELYQGYKNNFTIETIIKDIKNKNKGEDQSIDEITITEDMLKTYFSDVITKNYLTESEIFIFLAEEPDESQVESFLEKYSRYYFYCVQLAAYKLNGDYYEYASGNTGSIDIAEQFTLYNFQKFTEAISYNMDSSYAVSEGKFVLLKFNENDELAIDEIFLNNYSTNSGTDFKAENSYQVELNSDKDFYKNFSVKETFYGGNKGWYYAIWTGTEANSENEENPFSIDKVEKRFSSNNNFGDFSDSEDNTIQNKGNEKAEQLSNKYKDDNNSSTDEVQYNLSTVSNDTRKLFSTSKIKENETALEISKNDSNILIGTVTRNVVTYTVYNENDEKEIKYKDVYYFPYIKGNVINCSRIGGNSYYTLQGMPDNSISKALTRAESEGNEKTHKGNVSVSSQVDSASVGGSYTKGSSTSNMKQAFMDITGDRIPDVLIIQNSELYVYEGFITEDKQLCFKDPETRKYIKSISSSTNTTEGGGASFNGSNVFSYEQTKSGRIESVSASFGSSLGYFDGDDIQKTGFMDINGDGILDYVTESGVYIGTGKEILDKGNFTYSQSISVSSLNGGQGSISPFELGSLMEIPNGAESGKTEDKVNGSLSNYFGVNFGFDTSISTSNTTSTLFMTDINGDGLPDRIEQNKDSISFKVYYNLGNTFTENPDIITLPSWLDNTELDTPTVNSTSQNTSNSQESNSNNKPSYSESLQSSSSISASVSVNLNIDCTIQFPGWFGLVYKLIAAGGNNIHIGGGTTTVTTRFMDIDGDGLPDAVINTDKGIFYKKNMAGKADLIKSIHIPQGGNCNIDYSYEPPTSSMPMPKYVMSTVTMDDGSNASYKNPMPFVDNNNHETQVTYTYQNGFYDRKEREYYGFEKLTVYNPDGTYTISEFITDPERYWLKGFNSSTIQKTGTQYENVPDVNIMEQSVIPVQDFEVCLPASEAVTYSEADNSGQLSTITEYTYDNYYNVTDLETIYNNDNTKQIRAHIDYKKDTINDLYSLPLSIQVYGTDKNGSEELLRKREGDYNEKGQLIELKQYYKDTDFLKTILMYDEYGCIKTITDSTEVSLIYGYDDVLHQFVETITQKSKNDESLTTGLSYDYAYQLKTSEKDLNGNQMKYEYDNWQRITKAFSPYDSSDSPCVKFDYHTDDNLFWYVITKNKIRFDSNIGNNDSNYIETIVLQDGLSRVVQTAKTGYVCINPESDTLQFKQGWNVSGSVKYDVMGRVVEQGQTYFVEGKEEDIITNGYKKNRYNIQSVNITTSKYDYRGRVLTTELPDEAVVQNKYTVENGCLKTITTDPLGNITEQYTDIIGKISRINKLDSSQNLLTFTTYEYNMMGEMLLAYDAKDNPVNIEYDMLGRTLSVETADSGKKQYYYDDSPNLLREDDTRLRNNSRHISYEYDDFNRLIRINYMNKPATQIEYGTSEDKNENLYGRVKSVKDEGTSVSYKYGKLGQVTEETRIIKDFLAPLEEYKTATMKYTSDYLGRMQKIEYPDGEIVTYSYDAGGQVNKVSGVKEGKSVDYVKSIGYDEQGQRNVIVYGNKTKTVYKYNKKRGWLSNIETVNFETGNQYQNIFYNFDVVGNVSSYTNDCLKTGNYSTGQKYTYDALYQLIYVEGTTKYYTTAGLNVPSMEDNYNQTFEFDNIGNMMSKVSKETSRGSHKTNEALNYNLDYTYAQNYAHRVERAGDMNFVYDESGNLILEYEGQPLENPDEDNVVIVVEKDVYATEGAWGYGSNGNGGSQEVPKGHKRYYEWDDRNQLTRTLDSTYDTSYVYNNDGQRVAKYTSSLTATSETLYFNNFWTWHTDTANQFDGGQYSKNIYLGEIRIVTKLVSGKNNYMEVEGKNIYYYHTDHLGSASLVTNYEGKEYERMEYTPYGEVWVDIKQNTGTIYLPYKFSAKEMDSETGLYYYGARYLDPKYSMWKSTDPALAEYIPIASTNDEWSKKNSNLPGMGGIFNHTNFHLYHYAGNNPIRYIDPTGLEDDVSEAQKKLKRLQEIGEEIYHKGTINGINLYLENSEDGCFARAAVIAGELEKEGFEVTDYSYVSWPVLPGVIKSEKAAGRDPSKVPDKNSNGDPNRFRFHVAATVIIDGKKYVVDPFYHKSWLSISELEDWYTCQYPRETSTQPAHDKNGNLIAPATLNSLKVESGYTGDMSISEYAKGWLKNYDTVKKNNKNKEKKDNPYLWSGK